MNKLKTENEKVILKVNPVIDEFLNYGMTYLVYYYVPRFTSDNGFRAFTTKNKEEALNKQKELEDKAIFKNI